MISFYGGLVLGVALGWFACSICSAKHIPGRRRRPPAQTFPGGNPGYTWCPNCEALYVGEQCPGCSPDPAGPGDGPSQDPSLEPETQNLKPAPQSPWRTL